MIVVYLIYVASGRHNSTRRLHLLELCRLPRFDPNRLEEAAHDSQDVVSEMPGVPAFKGTRGAVLIRLGRFDEAIDLLEPPPWLRLLRLLLALELRLHLLQVR